MNERLTEHFALREFVVSRTAMVNNIDKEEVHYKNEGIS